MSRSGIQAVAISRRPRRPRLTPRPPPEQAPGPTPAGRDVRSNSHRTPPGSQPAARPGPPSSPQRAGREGGRLFRSTFRPASGPGRQHAESRYCEPQRRTSRAASPRPRNRACSRTAGLLPPGITVEMLSGPHLSSLRNPKIAGTFQRIGAIEAWGRGTNRVIDECRSYGLEPPSFREQSGMLVVTFRAQIGPAAQKEYGVGAESQLYRIALSGDHT